MTFEFVSYTLCAAVSTCLGPTMTPLPDHPPSDVILTMLLKLPVVNVVRERPSSGSFAGVWPTIPR